MNSRKLPSTAMVVISTISLIASFILYQKKLKKISATSTYTIPHATNVRGGNNFSCIGADTLNYRATLTDSIKY